MKAENNNGSPTIILDGEEELLLLDIILSNSFPDHPQAASFLEELEIEVLMLKKQYGV